jgi:hypothetical protein
MSETENGRSKKRGKFPEFLPGKEKSEEPENGTYRKNN